MLYVKVLKFLRICHEFEDVYISVKVELVLLLFIETREVHREVAVANIQTKSKWWWLKQRTYFKLVFRPGRDKKTVF